MLDKHYLQDVGGGTISGLLAARAAYAPDNVLLVFGGQDYTYAEVDRRASEVAAGLIALGLAPGDRASIFMTNRAENIFTWLGVQRAGLVSSTVNTAFKGAFLRNALDLSESKVLITEARLKESLATLDPPSTLRHVVVLEGGADDAPSGLDVRSWHDLLTQGDPQPLFPRLHPGDMGSISLTSGTTGRSKGVIAPQLMGVVMAKEAATAFALTPRDRMYTCMPLFHGMALVTTFLTSMYAGAATILAPRFSVTSYWDELRASGATQTSALGSMMSMLMTAPPSDKDREHDVKTVFSAPAPAEVLYRFERRFGVHVIEGYGSTEIKNVCYNPIQGRRVGSMGRPTPSSLLEIHDEQGNRLAPGEVGEVVYRPKMPDIMLKGYHKEPEKTLANMRNLWWRTGDMGSMDSEGFFYFFDRTADRLRRRGENISSQELEGALSAYPGINEVAAVAAPSELGEDEIIAVLEARDPAAVDFPALFAFACSHLPRFMVPRYYRVVPVLPRTPTGKVRKTELRDQGVTADTFDHVAAGLAAPR